MNLEKRFSRAPDRLYQNFRVMFDSVCTEYSGLVAMRARPSESSAYVTWTYADLKRLSYATGRWLISRGVKPGDRVAVIGENRPEWCFAYIACLVAGAVVVPLDTTLDATGMANILKAAGCKALFHSADHASKARLARASMPPLILADFDGPPESAGAGGDWSFAAALESVEPSSDGEGLPPAAAIDGDAAAVIIFTSGTTGVAKGIMLSHRGLIANVNAARQALFVGRDDVFIAILPLHHTYAATCTFLSPLEAGGSITFVEKLIPTVILRHVRDAGVTVMIGVPLLFDKIKQGIRAELAKLSGVSRTVVNTLFAVSRFSDRAAGIPAGRALLAFLRAKAGLRTVRLAVSGGGPLAWDTAEFYGALGLNLVQGYGMSENGPLISVNLPEYKDNRSAGVAVKHTRVRIAEPGSDGVGEIQVSSPSLMLGYLDAPEATEAAITPDGWLRTGDLGYVDRRGFIFITGRSKNLIVTEGGKNVYPEEIEMKFEGSPWIREILVLGRNDGIHQAGEQVMAVCVPDWDRIAAQRPGGDPETTAAELVRGEVRRVNKSLPQFMKIADVVIRNEEFEKTSSRKIRRFLYRSYAQAASAVGEARA